VSLLDAVPHPHEVGALLGQHHQTVLVLHLLQEHVEDVADLDAARVRELGERDHSFALEADVDQDFLVVDREHRAANDFALADGAQRLLVLPEHLGPRLEAELVVLVGVEGDRDG